MIANNSGTEAPPLPVISIRLPSSPFKVIVIELMIFLYTSDHARLYGSIDCVEYGLTSIVEVNNKVPV